MSDDEQPVMMRYEICVPVLPEYVQHYLDDGWTIVDNDKGRGAA